MFSSALYRVDSVVCGLFGGVDGRADRRGDGVGCVADNLGGLRGEDVELVGAGRNGSVGSVADALGGGGYHVVDLAGQVGDGVGGRRDRIGG